jgi:hypothetical protein
MVDDFDIIDFLHVLTSRSVELLDVPPRVCCWPTHAENCASCSSFKMTKDPAWTASGPASPWDRTT